MRITISKEKLFSAAAALSVAGAYLGALAHKKVAEQSIVFVPSPFSATPKSERLRGSSVSGVWLAVFGILITAATAALATAVASSIDRNGAHREWALNCESAVEKLRSDISNLRSIQRRPQVETELRAEWHSLDSDMRLVATSCNELFEDEDLAREIRDFAHIAQIHERQLFVNLYPEVSFYTDMSSFCERLDDALDTMPAPRKFVNTFLWRE